MVIECHGQSVFLPMDLGVFLNFSDKAMYTIPGSLCSANIYAPQAKALVRKAGLLNRRAEDA